MTWDRFLSEQKFADIFGRDNGKDQRPKLPAGLNAQYRTAHERDHDRILFSSPMRRLGDKTQVFPLESIESIRTRLTHSYEVANLARSIGGDISRTYASQIGKDAERKVTPILDAVGLAHDIGNPPFGHQGENAIRQWFRRNSKTLFEYDGDDLNKLADINGLKEQHRQDFLQFEGNAQTLRVLSKLQVIGDDLGLNLTFGTLASVMKYVAASDQVSENKQALKKVGYFASEARLVEMVRDEVGLAGDARHPLALLMEACDDIAYSVLDAEDSIKKGLVSYHDLIASLTASNTQNDECIQYVLDSSKVEHQRLAQQSLAPAELNDVSTQMFRVYAIHVMVASAVQSFKDNYDAIMKGTYDGDLVGSSRASRLCKALKRFDRENAFSDKSVLKLELNGYNVINRLMDFLWMGISNRKEYKELDGRRTDPFSEYVYSRISKNYRRVFEGKIDSFHDKIELPIRYKEMQLLTDMVSGMTDKFCIELHDDFLTHYQRMSPVGNAQNT